ncbi:DUF2787 domain-containing protein [Paraglaciecola chathamensis]|uniref:DUF2787 domain-containing protein n=1 Tax=Paraglaciecola chathamensis TaxID=368405 RepID=A0ABS0WHH0_9ALTE|nr:DUF2787 family protein [Paraglaciecola chathamensis]MBJ2137917.1 DUF2787 domain-containing protein [Paraglaciecola chathamensis]
MPINYQGLALPVSKKLADALNYIITQNDITSDSVTINFRDPDYSAKNGGFHPVEIRLEKRNDVWEFCYITDFCYVGRGFTAELAKDLDFDFQAGVFQNLFGVFPIEQATDIYQIWEANFLHTHKNIRPFDEVIL